MKQVCCSKQINGDGNVNMHVGIARAFAASVPTLAGRTFCEATEAASSAPVGLLVAYQAQLIA